VTEQPKKKPHHSRSRRYVPSEEARRFVLAMSGLNMTTDSIRCVIDPRMSKTTFYRAFRYELQNGSAHLHALVASKLQKAIDEEKPWAIMMAARNLPQYRWDRSGRDGLVLPPPGEGGQNIEITFITPAAKGAQAAPVDVTPPSDVYVNQPADLSKPALPAPTSRSIDPGYGLGPWRTDRDPNSWMK
jgi:hypothetical protein